MWKISWDGGFEKTEIFLSISSCDLYLQRSDIRGFREENGLLKISRIIFDEFEFTRCDALNLICCTIHFCSAASDNIATPATPDFNRSTASMLSNPLHASDWRREETDCHPNCS